MDTGFDDLAKDLLNNYTMSINSIKHKLLEIEFYLWRKNTHEDPFVHKHPEQLLDGHWYFHRPTVTSKKYKGGSFKGLDYTLGNGESYFGVLLRTIKNIQTQKVTHGPCKVVDNILELYNVSSIYELVDQGLTIDMEFSPNSSENEIYSGPRIGLNKRKNEYWALKRYRYVSEYANVKKGKRSLVKIVY